MKGSGSWTSFCPICGIHLRISFDKTIMDDLKEDSAKIKSKEKIIKLNKILSNFDKFKQIEKTNKSFSKYNKITILFPNGVIKHNIKYKDNDYFDKYNSIELFNPSKNKYTDSITPGLPMHTECWKLAQTKFNHILKFEDFLFNKYEKNNDGKFYSLWLLHYINYYVVDKYFTQDWINNLYSLTFENFLYNEKDWYILYLPSGESKEALKNSKRIEKNLLKIIKGITKSIPKKEVTLKDRPSPSESATGFKKGFKKKGNDGNMYIIDVNKNGVNRWKKIIDSKK